MPKFLGLLSLSSVVIALVLATAILFSFEFYLGLVYLVLLVVSSLIIVFSFCTKCSYKKKCAHVFPGLATKMLKDRSPGTYTKTDMTFVVAGILLMLGFPQFWLIRNWQLFLCFWGLNGIGLLIIAKKLCIRCENRFCPFNRTDKIQ